MIIDSANLTANGSSNGGIITNPNNGATPFQSVYASGNFGGGTLTVQISNDNGSTWFAATDSAGSVAFTANGAATLYLLGSGDNIAVNQIKVRGTLAGSTSPDINLTIADCR